MNTQWSSAISITDPRLANLDKYQNLAAAIVKVAADDYISAYRRKNEDEIRRLEAFFRGDEFILLTNDKIEAEFLISVLRKQARHGRKVVNLWAH